MHAFLRRVHGVLRLVRGGEFGAVVRRVREALWSDSVVVRLERDLTISFTPPESTIPIRIRPIEHADISTLLDFRAGDVSSAERVDRERRARLVRARLPTAYVAVTEDGAPCYVQWLVGSAENDRIQRVWNGEFPILADDEALLEGAFTPEAFRGRRVMPAAMARIAEAGAELGARRVITFVTEDNVPSLKGCGRAGFAPTSARLIRRRVFRTLVEPIPVPEAVSQYF